MFPANETFREKKRKNAKILGRISQTFSQKLMKRKQSEIFFRENAKCENYAKIRNAKLL